MIVDITVAAVLLISGVIALFRGFVKETLTLAAWIGAALVTYFGYRHIAPVLGDLVESSVIAEVVAAATLFLLSLVILTIFAHMASSRVKGTMLGPLDNALGFVFGLVRGAMVISLLYLVATLAWDEDDMPDEIAEARTLPMIVFGADILASLAPEDAFPGRDQAGDRLENAVEGLESSVGDVMEGVARERLDEMIEEMQVEERLRRLNQPEPEADPAGANAGETESGTPGEQPPPPGYGDAEREDMQRLIESTQ